MHTMLYSIRYKLYRIYIYVLIIVLILDGSSYCWQCDVEGDSNAAHIIYCECCACCSQCCNCIEDGMD